MKIAQIAPLWEIVPPRHYGGTERIVSYLTEKLVEMGHDVTLFASGDSRTKAKLVVCAPLALNLDEGLKDPVARHVILLEEVRRRADEFDILHFHIDFLHLPLLHGLKGRGLTTLHIPLDPPDLQRCYRMFPDVPLVSISKDQRHPMPLVNWVGTIHHGLPPDLLPYNPKPTGGYLAFLGRITPAKGPEQAIAIATRTNRRLKIAAKVDSLDTTYWQDIVEPLISRSPLVEYVGEVDEAQKAIILGNADAVLFPIEWREPFGLVIIEAMSCGTPVIAFRRGSVPEVVEDGVTGFIVDDVEGAVAAVDHLACLNRMRVREAFERRFTVERMTNEYQDVYTSIIGLTDREASLD